MPSTGPHVGWSGLRARPGAPGSRMKFVTFSCPRTMGDFGRRQETEALALAKVMEGRGAPPCQAG